MHTAYQNSASVLLTTGLIWVVLSPTAAAIELRTSYGQRNVVRNVSTTRFLNQPVQESESFEMPAVPEPAIEQWPGEEMLVYDTDCGKGAVACAPACCKSLWVELEFLLWWREGRCFPPLVTTDNPGILPAATVLFGGDQLAEQARPGGRLEAGWWMDNCQCLGVGGHYVAIGESSNRYAISSDQLSFIARPFFDADPAVNAPDAQVIANLPDQTGALRLVTDSEFIAADAFVRCLIARRGFSRVDFLFGYQFGRINEGLVIETTSTNPAIGTLDVRDTILTRNEFHGGHFGLQGEFRRGCWGLEMLAKFAFGNVRQEALLSGATSNSTQNSGLLVQEETNAGLHRRDDFSYMHDTGAKVFYYPTESVKVSLGYSLMFFSDVLRPGNQIDTAVDSRLFPTPPPPAPAGAVRPAFEFDPTHFYLHGLNLGLECRF
jgi:hypothetical protein